MKKIPTLFTRKFEKHKVVGIIPEITIGCEKAFKHGIATVKTDGSCCAIINGELYKRYDAKKGKPIPEGAIKCQEKPDPVTGHMPCWVKCSKDNPSDKWFLAAFDRNWWNYRDGTYEAIGPHFQGNPYYLHKDILTPHGHIHIGNVERTFEGVKEWLETHPEEGIVFWLNDEPVCKIKRTDFGFEWPIKKGGIKNAD